MQRINEIKTECCGCKACEQVCPASCIKMETDSQGFWYPKIDKSQCVGCGNCYKVCPEYQQSLHGDAEVCYAFGSMSTDEQKKYSSGGAFLSICDAFIQQDTDWMVYGAELSEDFVVRHARISKRSELNRLSGSKYVQSDTSGIYMKVKQDITNGRRVVFSGTPCQVQALKNFLKRDYSNLLLVDFVCHGVPSPSALQKYCEWLEQKKGCSLSKLRFRHKMLLKNGRWHTQAMEATFANGASYVSPAYEDCYMKAYLNELLSRPACANCKFSSISRCSDITLGDFWGIEKIKPELKIDMTCGTSLVMLNTDKGETTFKRINKDGKFVGEFDIRAAVDVNLPLSHPMALNPKHDEFYRVLNKGKYDFFLAVDHTLYPLPSIYKRVIHRARRLFDGRE